MVNGFGQAFGQAFQAGISSGREAKRAEAVERARQDQLGFQTRAEKRLIDDRAIAAEDRQRAIAAQNAEKKRLMAFRSELFDAVRGGRVQEILLKYPERAEVINKINESYQGIQGTQARRKAGQLSNALARGDKEGAREILINARDVIEGSGDPSFTLKTALDLLEDDPELLAEQAQSLFELDGGDPDKLIGVDQPLTTWQQAQIDIDTTKNDIAQANVDLRKTQQKIDTTTNDLQRKKLELEVQKKQAEVDEKQQKVKEARANQRATYDTMQEVIDSATTLRDTEGRIEGVTGPFDVRAPTVFTETQDTINLANRLKNLLTLDNLDLMTGVLSESDIKILASAATNLNVTDKGILGSPQAVRAELTRIINKMNAGLAAARKRGDLVDVEDEGDVGLDTTGFNPSDAQTQLLQKYLGTTQ